MDLTNKIRAWDEEDERDFPLKEGKSIRELQSAFEEWSEIFIYFFAVVLGLNVDGEIKVTFWIVL